MTTGFGDILKEEGPGLLLNPGQVLSAGQDWDRIKEERSNRGGIGQVIGALGDLTASAPAFGQITSSYIPGLGDFLDLIAAAGGQDPRFPDVRLNGWERLGSAAGLLGPATAMAAPFLLGNRVLRSRLANIYETRRTGTEQTQVKTGELRGLRHADSEMRQTNQGFATFDQAMEAHPIYGSSVIADDITDPLDLARAVRSLSYATEGGDEVAAAGHIMKLGEELMARNVYPPDLLEAGEDLQFVLASEAAYRMEALYRNGMLGQGTKEVQDAWQQIVNGSELVDDIGMDKMVKILTSVNDINRDIHVAPFRHSWDAIHITDEGKVLLSGDVNWKPYSMESIEFQRQSAGLRGYMMRNLITAAAADGELREFISGIEGAEHIVKLMDESPTWYHQFNGELLRNIQRHMTDDPAEAARLVKEAALATAAGSPNAPWPDNRAMGLNMSRGATGDDAFQVLRTADGDTLPLAGMDPAEVQAILDAGGKINKPSVMRSGPDNLWNHALEGTTGYGPTRPHPQSVLDRALESGWTATDVVHSVHSITVPKGGTKEAKALVARLKAEGKIWTKPVKGDVRPGTSPDHGVMLSLSKTATDLSDAKITGVRWGPGTDGNLRSPITFRIAPIKATDPTDPNRVLFASALVPEADDITQYHPLRELEASEGGGDNTHVINVNGKDYWLKAPESWSKEKVRNFAVAIYDPANMNTYTTDIHITMALLGSRWGPTALTKSEKFAPAAYQQFFNIAKLLGRGLAQDLGYHGQHIEYEGMSVKLTPSASQAKMWEPIRAMALYFLNGGEIPKDPQGFDVGQGFDTTVQKMVQGGEVPYWKHALLRTSDDGGHPEYLKTTGKPKDGLPRFNPHKYAKTDGVMYTIDITDGDYQWNVFAPNTAAHRAQLTDLVPLQHSQVGWLGDRPVYPWVRRRPVAVTTVQGLAHDIGGGTIHRSPQGVSGWNSEYTNIGIGAPTRVDPQAFIEALQAAVPEQAQPLLFQAGRSPMVRYVINQAEETSQGVSSPRWVPNEENWPAAAGDMLHDLGYSRKQIAQLKAWSKDRAKATSLTEEMWKSLIDNPGMRDALGEESWNATHRAWDHSPTDVAEPQTQRQISIEVRDTDALAEIMEFMESALPKKLHGAVSPKQSNRRWLDVFGEETLALSVYPGHPSHMKAFSDVGDIPEKVMVESLFQDHTGRVFTTLSPYTGAAQHMAPHQRLVVASPEFGRFIDATAPALKKATVAIPDGQGGILWGHQANKNGLETIEARSHPWMSARAREAYTRNGEPAETVTVELDTLDPLKARLHIEYADGHTAEAKPNTMAVWVDPGHIRGQKQSQPPGIGRIAWDKDALADFVGDQPGVALVHLSGSGGVKSVEAQSVADAQQVQILLARLGVKPTQLGKVTVAP